MAAAGKSQQIVFLDNNFRGSQKQFTIPASAQIKETKKLIKQNGETVEIVTLTLGNAPVLAPMIGSGGGESAVVVGTDSQTITLPIDNTSTQTLPTTHSLSSPGLPQKIILSKANLTSNLISGNNIQPKRSNQILSKATINDSIATAVSSAVADVSSAAGETATVASVSTSNAVPSAFLQIVEDETPQQSELIVQTSNTSSSLVNGQYQINPCQENKLKQPYVLLPILFQKPLSFSVQKNVKHC